MLKKLIILFLNRGRRNLTTIFLFRLEISLSNRAMYLNFLVSISMSILPGNTTLASYVNKLLNQLVYYLGLAFTYL